MHLLFAAVARWKKKKNRAYFERDTSISDIEGENDLFYIKRNYEERN